MKIKNILTIFFLIWTTTLMAANFKITFKLDSVGYTDPGGQKLLGGYVVNLTGNTIKVSLMRDQDLPDGWQTMMCFGTCVAPSVDRIENVAIGPHDSTLYDINFFTGSAEDKGQATLNFWDETYYFEAHLYSVSTQPTFHISSTDSFLQAPPGADITLNAKIINNTVQSRGYAVKRIKNILAEGWSSALGFNNLFEESDEDSSFIQLAAGDSADLAVRFLTDPAAEGSGRVTLVVSDTALALQDTLPFAAQTFIPEPAFVVSVPDSFASVHTGQHAELGGFVYNQTDHTITMNMVRDENNLPPNWSTLMCFGTCVSDSVDTVSAEIDAGDSLAYSITFSTDSTMAGNGKAQLLFFAQGQKDTIWQNFYVETSATGMASADKTPLPTFKLLGNYPNPFNPSTVISWQLPARLADGAVSSRVELTVYNINGQKIATLVNSLQKAGKHQITFNAANLPSGTYLYQLKVGGIIKNGKMLLLK